MQATLRLLGVTMAAVIASNLVIRLLNWAAEDVGDVRMPPEPSWPCTFTRVCCIRPR